ITVVLVDDDPVRDVETETGALADGFRGEERLEDAGPDVGRGAGGGVFDLDHEAVRVAGGAQGESATARHGVERVVDEVRPDLVQFGRVGRYGRQCPVVLGDHLNPGRNLRAEHDHGRLEQIVDVDGLVRCTVEL